MKLWKKWRSAKYISHTVPSCDHRNTWNNFFTINFDFDGKKREYRQTCSIKRSPFPAILQLYTPETVFKVDFQQTFFLVSARSQSGRVVETFLLKIRLLVCGGASQKNRSLFTLAALYRKPFHTFRGGRLSHFSGNMWNFSGWPLEPLFGKHVELFGATAWTTFRQACVAFQELIETLFGKHVQLFRKCVLLYKHGFECWR